MPRCSICTHTQRQQLDHAIAHGQRNVAEHFGVSRSAISRHRRHIRTAIAEARANETCRSLSLLDQVEKVAFDARRIVSKAEKAGKLGVALRGLREITRILELTGRLNGQLGNGAPGNVLIFSAADDLILQNHRRLEAMTTEELEVETQLVATEIRRVKQELALCEKSTGQELEPAQRSE